MKTLSSSALRLLFCCALASQVGCADPDATTEATVTLEGVVTYEDYKSGVVVLDVCESESSSYTSDGNVMVQTPGACVQELLLEAPGTFSTRVTVHWAVQAPDILLIAYLLADADAHGEDCEASAYLALPVEDRRDIELPLIAGECMMRL